MKKIRVGSRESKLAMVQTEWVIEQVVKKHPGIEFEIVPIKTKGDIILDTRLDKIGGKGLFIKELEYALIDGSIDMAVHSMKDMPAEIPDELSISCVSKREDPRDVLVTMDGKEFYEISKNAVVGTSSIRRELQIKELRPDFEFKTLRGNVLTRLNKLITGEYDAIVLAAAGLNRLGLGGLNVHYFEPEVVIPAVCQGILAIETRKSEDISFLEDSIYCETSAFCAEAERAFMIKLNGGCSTPMAAHAIVEGDKIKLMGMLAEHDMSNVRKAIVEGSKHEAKQLGEKLAGLLM